MNSHNIPRKTSLPVFKSTRLLDQLREQIRYLHYSLRTEEAYLYWVKHFIRFHGLKHPRDMEQAEIEAFLTASTNSYHAGIFASPLTAKDTMRSSRINPPNTVPRDPRSRSQSLCQRNQHPPSIRGNQSSWCTQVQASHRHHVWLPGLGYAKRCITGRRH